MYCRIFDMFIFGLCNTFSYSCSMRYRLRFKLLIVAFFTVAEDNIGSLFMQIYSWVNVYFAKLPLLFTTAYSGITSNCRLAKLQLTNSKARQANIRLKTEQIKAKCLSRCRSEFFCVSFSMFTANLSRRITRYVQRGQYLISFYPQIKANDLFCNFLENRHGMLKWKLEVPFKSEI